MERLAALPLFRGLDGATLAGLAEAAPLRRHGPGVRLFREGDPARAFFVVLSGRVQITQGSAEGRERALASFGPGGFFGEVALSSDRPHASGARVVEEAEVLAIPRRAFRERVLGHPEVAWRILSDVSARFTESLLSARGRHFEPVASRLARALEEHAEPARGGAARVPLTHQQLADIVGSARETVSRCLVRWARSGWIACGRGRIAVLDRGALRACRGGGPEG